MPVYAQHDVLESIGDVFCADALWQAPGFALFSRRPLLRDLLERHPREQRGHTATRCFAHVILTLPQEDIDDDYHLARGARARELEQALAALHQRDFGDLLCGDTVRYQVQGSDGLPPGAVGVRFGHAIYLPSPGEKIAFSASVSRDGAAWTPVCPVYAGQRLAMLGPETRHWPFGADGAVLLLNDGPGAQAVLQVRPRDAYECRFDAAHGHYVIGARHGQGDAFDLAGRLLLRISAPASARAARPVQPEAPGELAAEGVAVPRSSPAAHAVWQPRPAVEAPERGIAGTWQSQLATDGAVHGMAGVWQSRPADGGAASGTGAGMGSVSAWQPAVAAGRQAAAHAEMTTPAGPAVYPAMNARAVAAAPAAAIAARAMPLPAHVPPADDATALPHALHAAAARDDISDATYVPLARQRVTLAALALPRLSRYRDTGAQRLDIPLDAGQPAALAIDASDALHALSPAGHHPVAAPALLPQAGGQAIPLLAPPAAMADRYCALLPLPRPASVQLPLAGRHHFGRRAPALAALRLLDTPRLLHCAAAHASASADRIGLSREAFSFEASPQGIRIARLAPSQALYHLDNQLQFVASIGAASPDAPYLLPPGHHVAAGHYVLRFDA